ncbi:hypothetical protein KIF24_31725 [Micromonospora sp. Llam7]|uniref:hypothetical protein n=1 Tax=Micromonospora tarapacensis TaxID=2835305 RepID=UPI001C83D70C|nr:hypothetical protein [Micromonospora tarapacensis]MBX7270143.1 hypothetical protein [Micromonospora tarapacensis]
MYQPMDLPVLHEQVWSAMLGPGDRQTRRRRAIGAFATWLAGTVSPPNEFRSVLGLALGTYRRRVSLEAT